jgi:hypothetical protein
LLHLLLLVVSTSVTQVVAVVATVKVVPAVAVVVSVAVALAVVPVAEIVLAMVVTLRLVAVVVSAVAADVTATNRFTLVIPRPLRSGDYFLPVAIEAGCRLDWQKPKTVGFRSSSEELTKARIKRHPT